eukprot:CAMPEP_0181103620 /NCGR_PEP_ID=MMETSP1071-20121207/14964_1 /TAXON_ID=35127 /ORGANISM="Thalassiosira sp., Strain NH16" /LENGTH=481 /DNA_ID=CAMNT_0023186709 /DNA_START=38 /DNA_END=1483 /DNA_ORIENTATION=+
MGNPEKYNEELTKNTTADVPGWFQFFRRKSDDDEGEGGERPGVEGETRPNRQLRRQSTTAMTKSAMTLDKERYALAKKRARSHSMTEIPPIPSSIHSGDCDSTDGSVVSEMTLMTYSDEKNQLVKRKFIRCINQQKRDLTLQEKEALVKEIQAEVEAKYCKVSHALMLEQSRGSEQRLSQPDDEEAGLREIGGNWSEATPKQATTRGSGQSRRYSTNTVKHSNSIHNPTQKCDEIQCPEGSGSNTFSRFHSLTSKIKSERGIGRDSPRSQKIQQVRRDQPNEDEGTTELPRHAQDVLSETSSMDARIKDIIELKLLVANQQATIDTLSSKLHNLEVANRQLMPSEEFRRKNLEAENHRLAIKLIECRESEIDSRNELRNSQLSGECSNGDHQDLVGTNRRLVNENSNLRHQLQELRMTQQQDVPSNNDVHNVSLCVDGRRNEFGTGPSRRLGRGWISSFTMTTQASSSATTEEINSAAKTL